MKLFSKSDKPAGEPRCPGCCNNCPRSALKCDKGRRLLGMEEAEESRENKNKQGL